MTPADYIAHHGVRCLHHFTDRRNLPSIRAQGGLHPLAELRRREIEIPAPGGNDWSHEADEDRGLDEYVHLCFMGQHGMEYQARQEGRIQASCFLRVEPVVLGWENVRLTMDVSNKAGVPLLAWEDAWRALDAEVLFTRTEWKDPEINRRLQLAKKCEVLIPRSVPLNLIQGA